MTRYPVRQFKKFPQPILTVFPEVFHVLKILEAAYQYNKNLRKKTNRWQLTDKEMQDYEQQLSVRGSEIMGTLEIDSINVKLPIYHSTSEGVLQLGIGHIEGSSLPVGGLDTHAALTGHSGLPEAKLLTDLGKLSIGDTFRIHVLNQELASAMFCLRTRILLAL